MKKIISYSLWGNDPFYTKGAIENIKLADNLYPDWICRFYVSTQNTPIEVIEEIQQFSNAEVVKVDEVGTPLSMLWRFTAIDDDDVAMIISRDSDSRLSARERLAVKEWENSNYTFHLMRDHPYHVTEIMGGMWGMKKHPSINMTKLVDDFFSSSQNQKGMDQVFLREQIWQYAKNDNITHDPFFAKIPFPTPRETDILTPNVLFVGECFNADNTFAYHDHRSALNRWESGQ